MGVKDGKGNVYVFLNTEDMCWIDIYKVVSVLPTPLVFIWNRYTFSDLHREFKILTM